MRSASQEKPNSNPNQLTLFNNGKKFVTDAIIQA